MFKLKYFLPFSFLLAVIPLALQAQQIPFQGKLHIGGVPATGNHNFSFTISSIAWTENHLNIPVDSGLYSLVLGSISPLPANLFQSQNSQLLVINIDFGQLIDTVPIYAPIESDPTVPSNVKDGISWSEITGMPGTIDTSYTNELQLLSLSNDTLYLTNGNYVVLNSQADSLIVNNYLQAGSIDTTTLIGPEQSTGPNTQALSYTWQSFVPTYSGKVSLLEVYFSNGSLTNVHLKIFRDSLNTQSLIDTIFPGANFSTALVFQPFPLSGYSVPLNLSSNTIYYFEISTSVNINFGYDDLNPYIWGRASIDSSSDLLFKIHTDVISAASMVISDSGYVGINTNQPTSQLTVNGRIEDKTGFLMPVGSVIPWGGSALGDQVPKGWLLCDGRVVRRDIYADLFMAIQTHWGIGDGVTTFNIPDLRGMFLRGVDDPTTGSGVWPAAANNDPDATNNDQSTGGRGNYLGGNTGNYVGSYQNDALSSHGHELNPPFGFITQINAPMNASDGNMRNSVGTISSEPVTENTGGSETRPKNAYVNFIIKY
jgi:hypothetical protein